MGIPTYKLLPLGQKLRRQGAEGPCPACSLSSDPELSILGSIYLPTRAALTAGPSATYRREDGAVLAPQWAGTESLHGKLRMIFTRMWREVSKVRCPVS